MRHEDSIRGKKAGKRRAAFSSPERLLIYGRQILYHLRFKKDNKKGEAAGFLVLPKIGGAWNLSLPTMTGVTLFMSSLCHWARQRA
jgi:hypothetical protein